jgi:multiple antibiotic resistance protein
MSWAFVQAFFQAAIGIFAVVNPVGNLPVFVGLTEHVDTDERRRLFRLAGVTALIVISVMAVAGKLLLRYVFHISIDEFRFGGGLLLVVVGVRSIVGAGYSAALTPSVADDPEIRKRENAKLAVSPIAVPLLVGPGSIVTVMLTSDQNGELFALAACIVTFAVVILVLNYAHVAYRLMGRTGALAIGRVMQIFIIAIGVKFCMRSLASMFPQLAAGP